MLKRIIISLLFILCLGGVSASHYNGKLFYDDFMAVNQSETIMLYPYNSNLTAYYVGGNIVNMSNNGDYWYINILSDVVDDVPFYVNVFNGSFDLYNGSDGVSESYDVVVNNSLYYFKFIHPESHVVGEVADHEVCAELSKSPSSDPLNVRFFTGNNASVNVTGLYDVDYGDSFVVNSVVSNTYCSEIIQNYDFGMCANCTEFFGFVCDNCDSSNGLRVGVSNNNLVNNSFINENNNISNEVHYPLDFVINGFEFENDDPDELYFYDGLLKFRIPFNVTFNFYREYEAYDGSLKTEPLGNDFDYLYVVDYVFSDSYVSDNVFQSTSNGLPDFGVDFDKLNFNVNKDNYWFLWSSLSGGSGTITFYEPSNYTLYLRQTDIINDVVIDEFKKPVFSDTDFDTKIDVISVDGSVSSFDVVVDELEVRKIEFLRNILFYGGAFLIWFGIMIGLFYVGVEPKIALGVGFSILIFIMGGVSAII